MITVFYAHPYPRRSRACAALLSAIDERPGVQVRSLYELYPDFDIDPIAEREALARSDAVVWLHPLYWYTVPSLMKHWFDHVLVKGWAYGEGGDKLHGKPCLWVATTGADGDDYRPGGKHEHAFEAFVPVVEQTARFCGMQWQEPLIVHGAHHIPDEVLLGAGERLRARLDALEAGAKVP
jgi:glutathione-regulated potassium-efflux system ancillary protein KefF